MDRFRNLFYAFFLISCLHPLTSAHGELVSHYDAGTITGVSDGGIVSTWNDISGKGNNTSSSGGQTYVTSGIGGLASVQFSLGSIGFLSQLSMGSSFGIQGDAAWSMVVVFRQTEFSDSWRQVMTLGTGASPHAGALIEPDGSNLDLATGFGNDARLAPNDGRFFNQDLIVVYTHLGNTGGSILSTLGVTVNGYTPGEGILSGLTLTATGDAATAPFNLADNYLALGGHNYSATHSFGGMLSEVLVYNSKLTDAERDSLIVGLGRKYDIAVKGVPEPSTMMLCGIGAAFVVGVSRPRIRARRGVV